MSFSSLEEKRWFCKAKSTIKSTKVTRIKQLKITTNSQVIWKKLKNLIENLI